MGKQVKKHGYSCKLVRVVDGDTCDAMIDLGFDVWVKNRIRFYGVDTWESRTRDLAEKEKGFWKLMDIGTLNMLGYGEVIEISLWLAVMYTGKCYIDDFFNRRLK